jgi:hypothetical protein
LNFCGTTRFDVYNTSSHFAYHHMHPTDNGQGSRKRLLSKISGFPHKSIRNHFCNRIPTISGSLYTNSQSYFSCSTVYYIKRIITMDKSFCQAYYSLLIILSKKSSAILGSNCVPAFFLISSKAASFVKANR